MVIYPNPLRTRKFAANWGLLLVPEAMTDTLQTVRLQLSVTITLYFGSVGNVPSITVGLTSFQCVSSE